MTRIFKNKNRILIAAIVVLFAVTPSFALAIPQPTGDIFPRKAIGDIFSKVFGGRILFAVPCTCSGNYLLTIGLPRPATVVFQPGVSSSYLFHQFYRPGAWVLGNYSSGGSCYVYVGIACIYLPNSGTITKIGTSF